MERRHISPEKKVEILREHLDNNISISELAEKYKVHPNMISNWKTKKYLGGVDNSIYGYQ